MRRRRSRRCGWIRRPRSGRQCRVAGSRRIRSAAAGPGRSNPTRHWAKWCVMPGPRPRCITIATTSCDRFAQNHASRSRTHGASRRIMPAIVTWDSPAARLLRGWGESGTFQKMTPPALRPAGSEPLLLRRKWSHECDQVKRPNEFYCACGDCRRRTRGIHGSAQSASHSGQVDRRRSADRKW